MSFGRLERDAWTSSEVAGVYSRAFPPLTGHVALRLLDLIEPQAGELLVDLACGPGTVGRMAVARGCRVIGVDFSRPMLTLAGSGPDLLEPVRGSASHLPLRPGHADVITCNFGLLHFPDPELALAEATGAVRPGGRAGWSVWGEDAIALRLIPQAVARLGVMPPLPPAPDFFRFGDAGRFAGTLESIGLRSVRTVRVAWNAPFRDAAAFWEAFANGTARTRATIQALAPEDRTALQGEVEGRLQGFATPLGLLVPTTAILAVGTRP